MPARHVSFLGIVLVLAAVGCGGSSNNPLGISSGGTSAGRGGDASTGGRGGSSSGGSTSGGSAGAASTDAGSEGGAGGSSMAGAGGTMAAGGSDGRPAGCPEPNPIPVAGQTIVIQSINFDTAEMILRNPTSTPQSITLGRAGWQWCAFPRYWSLTDEEIVRELAPGETYSFIAINNQSERPDLYPEEGEMAIYTRIQAFDDYDALESFAAWGEGEAYRESYAVQRGVWTFGERIEIAPGHVGFIATGETNRASGYTSAPARCLVP